MIPLSIASAITGIQERNLEARRALGSDAPSSRGPFDLLGGIMPVTGTEPPVLGTRELLEGYESMPWLRAVAGVVSDAVASTEWRILARKAAAKADAAWQSPTTREELATLLSDAITSSIKIRLDSATGKLGDGFAQDKMLQRWGAAVRWKRVASLVKAGELAEIEDHPFFDALDNPNPTMQSRHVLLKITQLHLDLVGDAYWVKQRNGLGKVVGYWPIPPHWVWQIPVPSDPRYWVGYRAWQAYIPKDDVVWFHEPAPSNPYSRGSGVGWSLGDELEVDEYASKMAKALFFNQARPDFVVYGLEDQTEKNRLQRDWENKTQGFWRAHRPYFMTGEPKFHEFTRPDMQQLVYPGLRKAQRDIIIQTWLVPPEIFGISEHGLLAKNNYEGADYQFSLRVVDPRADRIRGTLQREFELEWDPRGVVDFISHVKADAAFDLSVMSKAPWAFNADEWRKAANHAPLPDGKVYLVPMNSYATDDLLDPKQRPAGAASGGDVSPKEEPAKDEPADVPPAEGDAEPKGEKE